MTMAIEKFYQDLTLETATIVDVGFGTEIQYTSETVKGIINQAGASEIEYANARQIEVNYKAYLEVNNLTKGIVKNDKVNGYRVTETPKNTVGRDHHIKVLLAEVE